MYATHYKSPLAEDSWARMLVTDVASASDPRVLPVTETLWLNPRGAVGVDHFDSLKKGVLCLIRHN